MSSRQEPYYDIQLNIKGKKNSEKFNVRYSVNILCDELRIQLYSKSVIDVTSVWFVIQSMSHSKTTSRWRIWTERTSTMLAIMDCRCV